MTTALQAVLVDITPPSRRGLAFGWITTASSFGNGAGPVGGSAVTAAFGFQAFFIAITPLYLLAAGGLTWLRSGVSSSRAPAAGGAS
jgi:MFS family permease